MEKKNERLWAGLPDKNASHTLTTTSPQYDNYQIFRRQVV